MSLDGLLMVSGDKAGVVIVWDTTSQTAILNLHVHEGSVLCCSISPSGRHFISSGQDEHICIIDTSTGETVAMLDDALDGLGLTAKFSFDGTRVLIGGEKGNILIWSVDQSCLLFEIQAHDGKVFDCSLSVDSRLLLSCGTDGKAKLWDAAAGAVVCQVTNFFGSHHM